MPIKFCPKCKRMLVPLKEGGKLIVRSGNCDFSEEINDKEILGASEKIKQKESVGKGVSSEKDSFATYDNLCKKCGYDKAQVLDMGVFYSDEDNLILLKCGKCGFSERIGRKIS